MCQLIERAKARQHIAQHILHELDLINLWNRYGTCNLVGSVAYQLEVAPDIDLEIFCPNQPGIEDGFEIIRACALHHNVKRTRFWNALGPPHHGLYWCVGYDHNGEEWKIDMWSMADSYSLPCGTHLIEPMKSALTEKTRETILSLKEAVFKDDNLNCPSIQIYMAVIDYDIKNLDELKEWLPLHPLTGVVTDWKPEKRK